MPTKNKYSSPVSIRLPHAVDKALKKQVKRLGVSKSQIILSALENFLDDPPKTLIPRPREADERTEGQASVFE